MTVFLNIIPDTWSLRKLASSTPSNHSFRCNFQACHLQQTTPPHFCYIVGLEMLARFPPGTIWDIKIHLGQSFPGSPFSVT